MSQTSAKRVKEEIRKLIESNITGYKINKETGIPESTIFRIRSGKIVYQKLGILYFFLIICKENHCVVRLSYAPT